MGDSLESVSGRVIHNGDYTLTHGANGSTFKISAKHSANRAVPNGTDNELCTISSDTADIFTSFESTFVDENGNTK